MSRNIRKKWLNAIPLTYLNFLAASSFLGLSLYLEHSKPLSICAFCLTARLLLVLLLGLSVGALAIPARRRIIYPTQLVLSVGGFLLSLRQLYFEKIVVRLASCPRRGANALQTIFNWLLKGAPACRKTYLIGPFSLSVWACIVFAILSFIAFQLYYKRARRR